MRSRRTITLTLTCLVAALMALPAAASAGPLLSGYGGPGQGSQVILGSSLIKGGGGGDGPRNGGGSSGTGESSASGSGAQPATAATGALATHAVRPARPHSKPRGRGRAVATGGQVTVVGGAQAQTSSSPAAAVRAEAEGPTTIGVSRENLLYMLLALGALILTGLLTKRLARSTPASGAG
jgi:hypothetical protein